MKSREFKVATTMRTHKSKEDVSVHSCYPIGYFKHADGGASRYRITVRRPTIGENCVFIHTTWEAAYLFPPGKSPGPCFEEARVDGTEAV